jgi:hypothetical protein
MTPDQMKRLVNTTVGELAAAYYEAALEQLGNEELAAAVSQQLVAEAMRKSKSRD